MEKKSMDFQPWAWESENWGGDSEGPLAKALEKARNQKPKPLKLTKLPHRDQKSLKDFEAESFDAELWKPSDAEFWEYDFINQQIETGDLEDERNHRVVGKNINSKDGELIVELHNDYQREGLMSWGDEKHPLFNKLVHREYDAETFGTEVFETKPMQPQFYKTKSQRLATLNRAIPVGVKHLKEYIHRWNGKTFFDMVSFTPEDIEEGWERIKNQLRSKEIIYSIEDLQRDYNRIGRAVQGAGAVYVDSPTMKGPKGEYADDVNDAWQYLHGDLVEIGEKSGYSYKDWGAESFEAQATHIDWETDGQEVDLPKTVEVPDDLDADEIADYLSDEYGFLVNAFQIKDAESYDAELEDYSPEELTTSNVNVGDFMVDAGKGSYGSEEGYMADWENAPYSSWDDAWSDDVNFPRVEKQEKLWLKNLTTIGVLAGAIYIGRKIKGV